MKKIKPEALLTVIEVAGQLGVSESTVWRMLRRGELTSVRRSGKRLVPRVAVQRRSRAVPAQKPRPLSPDHPMWRLVGAFKSGGAGPGSADKYAALFGE